jgi:hypothetical protein
MTQSSIAIPLRACMVAAMLAASASPAFSANYTWKTLSGTGNWTDSVNWSGTSATNLYPGSVGSGTADAAFIQANYTSAPTINLNTSAAPRVPRRFPSRSARRTRVPSRLPRRRARRSLA